jgi:GNAT superfamily N-acetyltransferase
VRDDTAMTPAVRFRPARADEPPGGGLLEAMIAELEPLYGRIDVPEAPSASPADFASPGGAFLVGELEGRAVCCGGLKRLDDAACELKRMYVVPAVRGQGVARALLAALEEEARRLGYAVARLDTGPHQPHAERLYRGAGYAPIADFNANPFASFWGEKALLARA